jgi:putative transposase
MPSKGVGCKSKSAVYNHAIQRLQAFKYELMPHSEQQGYMRRFVGSFRFVYNTALAMQNII